MNNRIFLLTIAALLLFSSCAPAEFSRAWHGRLIMPGQVVDHVPWVSSETKSDVAIRKLRNTVDASFQIVRLNTAEKPHVHATHDLTVFVLKGRALMHLAGQTIKVKAGDVIDIPRGVPHWVENKSKSGSEVFAVFTPAFDGRDTAYPDAAA